MRYRTGTIYSEITNKGRSTAKAAPRGVGGVIYCSRWVGEIMVNGRRYRFRSSNYDNVRHWVDMMVQKYPTYETFPEKESRKLELNDDETGNR